MDEVTVTFTSAEAMYVLDALTRKSADAHARTTVLLERGARLDSFEMSVVTDAARYTDAAHRKMARALFPEDEPYPIDDPVAAAKAERATRWWT